MERNFTNKINWCLDQLLPPILRDSRWFMSILFRIALGKKYRYYMEFKEAVPDISEEEINHYYELLADTFIKRDTDNSVQCVEAICQLCKGDGLRILDVACGKGYLINKVAENNGLNEYHAVDIVLPKKQKSGIHYQKASITDLPYSDQSFDVVICTHALEHIKNSIDALNELRRICKDKLIIVLPKQREYRYTFDLHIHFFPYNYSVKNYIQNPKATIIEKGSDWLIIENRN